MRYQLLTRWSLTEIFAILAFATAAVFRTSPTVVVETIRSRAAVIGMITTRAVGHFPTSPWGQRRQSPVHREIRRIRKGRRFVISILALLCVAVAMRTLPLYWTPLPYGVDSYHFIALAQESLASGSLPTNAGLTPDEFVFTTFVATISTVTGVDPLAITQPLIAVVGSIPCLAVAAIAKRSAERLGWQPKYVRQTAILAGVFLAVDGIYLSHSIAATSDVFGLLFVIVLAIVFHRTVHTGQLRWAGLSVLLVGLLPITHTMAAIIGALVVTAMFASSLYSPTIRGSLLGGSILVGYWTYLSGYSPIAELGVIGRVASLPGLFVAWLIILVALTVWLPRTTATVQRVVLSTMLIAAGIVVIANLFLAIFPGTARTEPLAVMLTAPLALVGFVAVWGAPYASQRSASDDITITLLFGPLVLVEFALSGKLVVDYHAIATRGQVYLHVAIAILAALAAVGICRRRSRPSARFCGFRRAIVPLLALCLIISAPLAFIGLSATPAQSTVSPAEFQTTTFAAHHVPSQWASDGHIASLASSYYAGPTARYTPIYEWVRGETAPPNCPTVAQRSWTTVGAQLSPASPATVSATEYDAWLNRRNVVYSVNSDDPLVLVAGNTAQC
ncbi:sodium/phosphate symporter [Haladaptatus sp. NG-SE-30]